MFKDQISDQARFLLISQFLFYQTDTDISAISCCLHQNVQAATLMKATTLLLKNRYLFDKTKIEKLKGILLGH